MLKPDESIVEILRKYRNIAIVGISDNPSKPSHQVAEYLKSVDYNIFPVNPKYQTVLNLKCYPTLTDIPAQIEIVDVFRRTEFIPDIVEESISIGARVIWMQLGLVHDEAAQIARQAGLEVIMNHCMKIEHQRFVI